MTRQNYGNVDNDVSATTPVSRYQHLRDNQHMFHSSRTFKVIPDNNLRTRKTVT